MKWFLFLLMLSAHAVLADERTKVLFLGDSHTDGVFGDTLDEMMREKYDVASFGTRGSTSQWYLDGTQTPWAGWSRLPDRTEVRDNKPYTPHVSELLKQQAPNAVVIALGTNFVWLYSSSNTPQKIAQTDSQVEVQVKSLLQAVQQPGRACIWIGPPQLGPKYSQSKGVLDHVREIERKAASQNGCTFIDSFSVTGYPEQGGDSIHYDRAGPEGIKIAKAWARYVSTKVDEVLKPTQKSVTWKLTPPKTDPHNRSYVLNQAELEDRCGWTQEPRFALNPSSTTSHILSKCAGGRAHCRVTWTDSQGRGHTGNYFIGFRCRAHEVTTHGYSPDKDTPEKMDWLPDFQEECAGTASFKAEDLLQAGCEPSGAISPDLGQNPGAFPKSGTAR